MDPAPFTHQSVLAAEVLEAPMGGCRHPGPRA